MKWHKAKYLVLAFTDSRISFSTASDLKEAEVLAIKLDGFIIQAPIIFSDEFLKAFGVSAK